MKTIVEFPVSRMDEVVDRAREMLPEVTPHIQNDRLDGRWWYSALLSRAWEQIRDGERNEDPVRI